MVLLVGIKHFAEIDAVGIFHFMILWCYSFGENRSKARKEMKLQYFLDYQII